MQIGQAVGYNNPAPQDYPPIQGKLEQLSNTVGALAEHIAVLSDKLSPVRLFSAAVESTKNNNALAPVPNMSVVEQQIQASIEAVAQLSARICSLRDEVRL